jgi:hypothetical protein
MFRFWDWKDWTRFAIKILVSITILLMFVSGGCNPVRNIDYVKDGAITRWAEVGYEVIGYEGYHWGLIGFGNYGGACVWYRLKNIPENNVTYTGYLIRWGNEIHIYGPDAIDAIKTK